VSGDHRSTSDPEHHDTRMQAFWSWLALSAGKHAGIVGLIGLVLTLVLGYGITKLEFATGQDSYLNSDDQVAIDNERYQELFGGQAMLVLFTLDEGVTLTDMLSPANQAEFAAVAEELAGSPDLIESTVTPVDAITWSDALIQSPDGNPANSIAGQALLAAATEAEDPADQEIRTADSVATLARLDAIPPEQRTLDNPEWVDFLIYDNAGEIRLAHRSVLLDESHMQMVVRLVGNASIDVEGQGAEVVKEVVAGADFEGAEITVTGAPILLKEINDYLKGGMLQLGAIAVVIMTIILLLLFDVRWRLLPLAVIVVGVIWAFGLAGYLGIPLSLVTIAGLPVMLGIGIDYAIQMHARVEEEVIIDRNPHPIQETARNLGPALLVVTFDAVFAFTALRFAQVPMIRAFGQLLSVGIAVICLASIVVPLSTLGIREYKSPTKGRDYREGPLGRLTVFLGSIPARWAPVFAVASLVIFFGGVAVEDDLVLQSDPVEWVNQSGEGITDLREVEEESGSSSELAVFVESDDIFSEETIGFVNDFAAEQLELYPDELLTASSLVTTVTYLLDVPGATPAVPRPVDVESAFDVAPVGIQASTVNVDAGAMNLIFRTGPSSLDERAVVVNEISESVDPPDGVTATPSGLAVVGVGLLENLEANRVLLTYLAIIFVGLFLAVRLRSVVRSLLSLVPVLIAVGMASLVAFAFDLKLSPMTAVGGPLVVAACTEFTSLILLRFVEERRRGLEPREAVDIAAGRTGRAFIVSGLTAISGVAVIATSSLPLLRDFGQLVAMNVAVALLAALVILPPLLVWADQRGWVSKGMIPDDVLEATTPKLRGKAQAPEPEPEPATTASP
jgi:hydrophobe/amphiphile efflux-3 (HAE3) family protein